MHSRKSGFIDPSEYSSRGKANPEVQHLIEKQKRNLEEFDKMKKAKNFEIGIVDVYNTSRPSYQEARPEVPERITERGSNRKSINNMNNFE